MTDIIKNQIGITTAAGYNFPYEERFRLYKEYGFSTVMLGWEEDDTPREKRVSLAHKAGLEIENVHSDFSHTNCMWKDGDDGETKLKNLIKSLEDCAAYGIPVMVMHLSNGTDIPEVTDIGLFRFKTLLEKAVKLNVTLAVENVRTEKHVKYVLEHFHKNLGTDGERKRKSGIVLAETHCDRRHNSQALDLLSYPCGYFV
jgi:hydroxypyruvate isomerase